MIYLRSCSPNIPFSVQNWQALQSFSSGNQFVFNTFCHWLTWGCCAGLMSWSNIFLCRVMHWQGLLLFNTVISLSGHPLIRVILYTSWPWIDYFHQNHFLNPFLKVSPLAYYPDYTVFHICTYPGWNEDMIRLQLWLLLFLGYLTARWVILERYHSVTTGVMTPFWHSLTPIKRIMLLKRVSNISLLDLCLYTLHNACLIYAVLFILCEMGWFKPWNLINLISGVMTR